MLIQHRYITEEEIDDTYKLINVYPSHKVYVDILDVGTFWSNTDKVYDYNYLIKCDEQYFHATIRMKVSDMFDFHNPYPFFEFKAYYKYLHEQDDYCIKILLRDLAYLYFESKGEYILDDIKNLLRVAPLDRFNNGKIEFNTIRCWGGNNTFTINLADGTITNIKPYFMKGNLKTDDD